MEENTQKPDDRFVQIRYTTLTNLIKTNNKLSNMLVLLSYICEQKKVEMTLSATEVCEVLKIKPSVLEDCRKKKWIKSWTIANYQYYKAYDIAKLAERINRRKILRKLSKIPFVQ